MICQVESFKDKDSGDVGFLRTETDTVVPRVYFGNLPFPTPCYPDTEDVK